MSSVQPRRIRRLPPDLAEKIAAGEIIERPASIVKELLENSLDAGATEVSVVLVEGGKALIEVIDNGHGMDREDLMLCVERHATSKLASLSDLDRIETLGFRGEALPSVAAVSELKIISRVSGGPAHLLTVRDHGQPPLIEETTFGHFNHSEHGTKIQCASLFSQIPARLKFLKSSGAEVFAVRDWMERLALAYPQVGFKLTNNDKVILDLRPRTEERRVLEVLGDGDDFPIVTVRSVQDGVHDLGLRIRIHWVQGMSSPSTKKLVQVINRRAVRDRMLQQSLLSPFKQALLPGQFPAVALFIEITPSAIDVNVHPTKAEIRFLESRKIFSAMDELVKSMLSKHGTPGFASGATSRFAPFGSSATQSPQFFGQAQSFVGLAPGELPSESPDPGSTSVPGPFQGPSQGPLPSRWAERPPAFFAQDSGQETFVPSLGSQPVPSRKLVGQFFNTYFMFEQEGQLILVDQHAAHERVRYEALSKAVFGKQGEGPKFSAQGLLVPEVVKIPNGARLQKSVEQLLTWGFEAEFFGEDTLLFRAVPAEWGSHQLKVRLRNLVERLAEHELERDSREGLQKGDLPKGELMDEHLFEALASEACHSAVRAGDPLLPFEVTALYDQLMQCDHPWNCPHGRPTVVKLNRSKVEEWFQRTV